VDRCAPPRSIPRCIDPRCRLTSESRWGMEPGPSGGKVRMIAMSERLHQVAVHAVIRVLRHYIDITGPAGTLQSHRFPTVLTGTVDNLARSDRPRGSSGPPRLSATCLPDSTPRSAGRSSARIAGRFSGGHRMSHPRPSVDRHESGPAPAACRSAAGPCATPTWHPAGSRPDTPGRRRRAGRGRRQRPDDPLGSFGQIRGGRHPRPRRPA
jgi:hypothetical protein